MTERSTAQKDQSADELEADDPVTTAIAKTGCLSMHYAVQECMFEHKDWRQCQKEVKEFRGCIEAQRSGSTSKPTSPASKST